MRRNISRKWNFILKSGIKLPLLFDETLRKKEKTFHLNFIAIVSIVLYVYCDVRECTYARYVYRCNSFTLLKYLSEMDRRITDKYLSL